MPKVKTLVFTLFVIALSFSLIGCGMLTSFTSSSEEVVEVGGQIPEWLLLSHRSIASEESDIDDELAAIDEDEEEKKEDVTADSDQTEQATSEVAQAADSGSAGYTQEEPSGSNDSGSPELSEKQQLLENMVPGKREHLLYLQNKKSGESKEDFVDRLFETAEKAAEKEETGDWFHDMDSPSGFGHSKSSDDDDDDE